MDASEKPKRDESEDRICTERSLDLIAELRGDLQTAKRELETTKLELKKSQERISERTLRNPAEARDTGRTNKTSAGTRWRTIVTSVLESLRLYLPKFTLATVIAEVRRWEQAGKSCFEKLLTKLKIPLPEESILDSLYPPPSG